MVEVRTSLGPTGDIEAGTAAVLAGEGLKEEDFSLEVGWQQWGAGLGNVAVQQASLHMQSFTCRTHMCPSSRCTLRGGVCV